MDLKMNKIDSLLQRLIKVKGRNGNWTACCPAHEDKSPSLAVRQHEDGRILLHCFGGCDVNTVLGALGMTITDLFPEKIGKDHSLKPIKPAFFATDLLRIIHFEALVVQLVSYDIAKNKPISEQTRERMLKSFERIDEATRYANI